MGLGAARMKTVGLGSRTWAPRGLVAGLLLALAGLWAAPAAFAEELVGNIEAARDKVSNCTGCHGIKGYRSSFPTVYTVPRIAGQTERYLINALIAYRKGDRDHPSMSAIAAGLSDQDIADLAAFYAQSN